MGPRCSAELIVGSAAQLLLIQRRASLVSVIMFSYFQAARSACNIMPSLPNMADGFTSLQKGNADAVLSGKNPDLSVFLSLKPGVYYTVTLNTLSTAGNSVFRICAFPVHLASGFPHFSSNIK